MRVIGFTLVAGSAAIVLSSSAGCFRDDDDDEVEILPDVECKVSADCAFLDDGDSCFGAPRCENERCERDFLQNTTDCQCRSGNDCEDIGYQELGCNILLCEAGHQCAEAIVQAGPAPDQDSGDCVELRCDGVSKEPIEELDLEDFNHDQNSCTADGCTEEGPINDPLEHGATCLDQSGICYDASCFPGCVPANPESCSSEGQSEPVNDVAGTASFFGGTTACGMLGGDDVDWYRKDVVDESFEADVLQFAIHSSAATVTLCAHVECWNWQNGGIPDGGCQSKVNTLGGGHWGCCWTGAPETIAPSWDVDCTGTDDDSGKLLFSVRAVDGEACETYTVDVTE